MNFTRPFALWMIMSVHFIGIVSLQETCGTPAHRGCYFHMHYQAVSLASYGMAGSGHPGLFAGDNPLFLTRESGSFIGAHFKCSILFWDVMQQFLSSGLLLRSACRALLNPLRFQTV